MTKVLITGATGNVGMEVIKSLQNINHQLDLYAGVRSLTTGNNKLDNYKIKFLQFDFTDTTTYEKALNGCSILFLLRPPQI
jgi:short-subunit dehydrogenase